VRYPVDKYVSGGLRYPPLNNERLRSEREGAGASRDGHYTLDTRLHRHAWSVCFSLRKIAFKTI